MMKKSRFSWTGIDLSRPCTFLVAGILVIALAPFMCPGCGPTNEEIMAREQARLQREAQARAEAEARRQAEEARRHAEESRLARIRAVETAGDDAARQGELEKALDNYQEVLKNVQRYSEQDQRVRQAVIKVVRAMPAPPPLPESAMRYVVRGEAKVKAGGTGSYEAAAEEMEQAVLEAPWFADGYFNLATVQDKAGRFGRAIRNFQLCLFADPQSRGAAAVQAKIYELEVKQEEAIKTLQLLGGWRNLDNANKNTNFWGVTLKDGKIYIGDEIQVERKGRALEGFFLITWPTIHNCNIPSERVPITGTISEDGTSMELHYEYSNYQVNWQGQVCTGVALLGKVSGRKRLVQESRCRLCMDAENLTPEKARSLGLQGIKGALVLEPYKEGPADKAGIRQGDVIVAYQGKEIPDDATFSNMASATPLGSEVRVTFMRAGKLYDAVVKTGAALTR
jgi:tetratricopeptide (TPR) repeat protein